MDGVVCMGSTHGAGNIEGAFQTLVFQDPVGEVDDARALVVDEAELMAILQPKFEEIYKMIADIKSGMEDEEVAEEVAPEEVQMSVSERFSQVQNFLKKKK